MAPSRSLSCIATRRKRKRKLENPPSSSSSSLFLCLLRSSAVGPPASGGCCSSPRPSDRSRGAFSLPHFSLIRIEACRMPSKRKKAGDVARSVARGSRRRLKPTRDWRKEEAAARRPSSRRVDCPVAPTSASSSRGSLSAEILRALFRPHVRWLEETSKKAPPSRKSL